MRHGNPPPDEAALAAIIDRLTRLGARRDEIDDAIAHNRLDSLTIEYLLNPERSLTIDEVAANAGANVADALRLWRAWGFPTPSPTDRRFGPADVEHLRFALDVEQLMGAQPAYDTARVMGVSISRIAEAEVAMLRSVLEAPMRAEGASDEEVLAAFEVAIGSMADVADTTLASLHRHHLVETVRRQIDALVKATSHNVLDVVIGFADLTGSTRLAAQLELEQLDYALAVFEERTADIIAMHGASLVKRIGDAVMFTSASVAVAAEVAIELVQRFDDDPVVPTVRVGMAAGTVVARRGDFYGLPVALAARLQSSADPSTVLVDREVAERLRVASPTVQTEPSTKRELAGFDTPVPTFKIMDRR